jgi:tetratricopeptide (TPR) repeat protein
MKQEFKRCLGWSLTVNEVDASALFKRALIDHPRDFWLHLHALRWTTDREARAGLALAALAVRPQSAGVYCSLAWNLQDRGDWRGALAAAERAIEINPNYSEGYVERGLALRGKKDLPGAAAALKRAIELEPGPGWARYCLGEVFQQQGRYAEAEQAYLGAIQAQPASSSAYALLAWLLATCPDDKARDGKRALEYATTACERSGWKDPWCRPVSGWSSSLPFWSRTPFTGGGLRP